MLLCCKKIAHLERIKIMPLKKDTGEKCVRTEAVEMCKIIGIGEEVEYDT